MPPGRVVAVWARALRRSPRSDAVSQFHRQVEHFLRTYGTTIWGRTFDADASLKRFSRAAGIR